MGAPSLDINTPPPHHSPQEVQNVEEVQTRFGPNLAPKMPEIVFLLRWGIRFRFRFR